MEDECHNLDMKMAKSSVASDSDKQSYRNFTAMIHRERELLDKKKTLQDHVKLLDQTLSLLTLMSTSATPVNSGTSKVVSDAIKEKKKEIGIIVSQFISTKY